MATDFGKARLDRLLSSNPNLRHGLASFRDATILKQVTADGRFKVYEDHTQTFVKEEILLPGGQTILLHKILFPLQHTEEYKDLQIFSTDNQLLDTIEILSNDHIMHNRNYRFFYQSSVIGTGKGNVGICIAKKLLNLTLDSRFLVETSVEDEVIKAINDVIGQKNY